MIPNFIDRWTLVGRLISYAPVRLSGKQNLYIKLFRFFGMKRYICMPVPLRTKIFQNVVLLTSQSHYLINIEHAGSLIEAENVISSHAG